MNAFQERHMGRYSIVVSNYGSDGTARVTHSMGTCVGLQ